MPDTENARMHIVARVKNCGADHAVEVSTEGRTRTVAISAKAGGGSDVNGGELLFLALATCYCNDLYREAARAGIVIENVEVTVEGDFGAAGRAGEEHPLFGARRVECRARPRARAAQVYGQRCGDPENRTVGV